MAETIDKVRHTTLTQEKETQDVIEKLNAENSSLKQQMENKHEALKRDNVWLVNAVQGLKDETMELQRYAILPFLTASLLRGSIRYFVVVAYHFEKNYVILEFHDCIIFTLLVMK